MVYIFWMIDQKFEILSLKVSIGQSTYVIFFETLFSISNSGALLGFQSTGSTLVEVIKKLTKLAGLIQ